MLVQILILIERLNTHSGSWLPKRGRRSSKFISKRQSSKESILETKEDCYDSDFKWSWKFSRENSEKETENLESEAESPEKVKLKTTIQFK